MNRLGSIRPTFYRRYLQALVDPSWAMDLRHVLVVHELLAYGPFSKALEIGTHYGVSTTAFVEAAERRTGLHAYLCDQVITGAVRRLVVESPAADRLRVLECSSVEALRQLIEHRVEIDFALLDGSHTFHDVQTEMALLCCLGTRTLLLHDCHNNSADRYGRNYLFDGPAKIVERLRSCSRWLVVIDSQPRKHERTDRGLALVTRDRATHTRAVHAFSRWSRLSLDEIYSSLDAFSAEQ